MLSLRELQQQFAAAVFDDGTTPLPVYNSIKTNGLDSAERLGIYRNNMFVGLSSALTAAYPVVAALVGADFFRFTARQYILSNPSVAGDLSEFGAGFAEFLQAFEPAAQLSYLPDTARLEFAYHRALGAASHPLLNTEALSRIDPEYYETLRFTLHPSAHLIASEFPILRIWQVNQADYSGDQTVDLSEPGSILLVVRRDLDVTIESLTVGTFTLLQALAESQPFGTACERALLAEADYDVTTDFQQLVGSGVLVDFSI